MLISERPNRRVKVGKEGSLVVVGVPEASGGVV